MTFESDSENVLSRVPLESPSIYVPYLRREANRVSGFNWEQAVRVLRKNWKFSAALAFSAVLLTVLFTLRMRDSYQTTARVEVDPPGSAVFSTRDMENALENHQDYLETQAQILQSDDLAMRVIRKLRLDRRKEVVGEKNLAKYTDEKSESAKRAVAVGGMSSLQEQFQSAEHTPLEAVALRYFKNHLSVNNVRNSRLIEVSFSSENPRLSQQATNELLAQFIDQNFKTRYENTMQASEWLSSQLNDLRRKVEDSNQAVVEYQKRFGLVEADEKEGPTTKLAEDIGHELSQAQASRIQSEAYVRMIDTGQAESLPQIRESQVYQTLTARYADSRAKLAQARTIYGEENQSYKKIQNEVNELGAQREAEEARIVNQVRTSYSASLEREHMMLETMDRVRTQMGDTNERLVRYRVLRNEAQANADLYNTLLSRLKEAGVYAGLKSSNIRLVDTAPVLDRPTGPNRAAIIGLGGFLGCIFALGLAFVRESMSNTVRTPDDVREWTNLPSLAMIPSSEKGKKLNNSKEGRVGQFASALASSREAHHSLGAIQIGGRSIEEREALQNLRASIQLSREGQLARVLLVASAVPGEGKSTVAANLAATIAKKAKVCLIDADLRSPSVSQLFGIFQTVGLGQILAGTATLENSIVRITGFENLSILPSGQSSNNPADLLGSKEMKTLLATLRQNFDHVIIDSPPLIPFSDARIVAAIADGVLLVGRYEQTTHRSLARAAQILEEAGAHTLGVVLNGMDFESADYHYYNYGFSSGKSNEKVYRYAHAKNVTENSNIPPQENTKARGAGAGRS